MSVRSEGIFFCLCVCFCHLLYSSYPTVCGISLKYALPTTIINNLRKLAFILCVDINRNTIDCLLLIVLVQLGCLLLLAFVVGVSSLPNLFSFCCGCELLARSFLTFVGAPNVIFVTVSSWGQTCVQGIDCVHAYNLNEICFLWCVCVCVVYVCGVCVCVFVCLFHMCFISDVNRLVELLKILEESKFSVILEESKFSIILEESKFSIILEESKFSIILEESKLVLSLKRVSLVLSLKRVSLVLSLKRVSLVLSLESFSHLDREKNCYL